MDADERNKLPPELGTLLRFGGLERNSPRFLEDLNHSLALLLFNRCHSYLGEDTIDCEYAQIPQPQAPSEFV